MTWKECYLKSGNAVKENRCQETREELVSIVWTA